MQSIVARGGTHSFATEKVTTTVQIVETDTGRYVQGAF